MLVKFLLHLKAKYPLSRRRITIKTYDSASLPNHLWPPCGTPITGCVHQYKVLSRIHLATDVPLRSLLITAAHEYRHAWQYDTGNKERMEVDAVRFSWAEAIPYYEEHCEVQNG